MFLISVGLYNLIRYTMYLVLEIISTKLWIKSRHIIIFLIFYDYVVFIQVIKLYKTHLICTSMYKYTSTVFILLLKNSSYETFDNFSTLILVKSIKGLPMYSWVNFTLFMNSPISRLLTYAVEFGKIIFPIKQFCSENKKSCSKSKHTGRKCKVTKTRF